MTDEPTDLDPWHVAIVDAVCQADAARAAAGDLAFLRLAVEHEFCAPGGDCVTWPTVVRVHAIAPGLRIRQPIAPEVVAA